MLLVYSHQITPRLKYVFRHICTRILHIPVSFTSIVEEFIAHDDLKISYTKQPLSNEFFVQSHDLLFQQGISDLDINVQDWDGVKCFFAAGDKSVLPYDIFAASFYLLSRYEEYLPHVKDEYGRFTAEESLAYKNGFLEFPVVDIWAYRFISFLETYFPNYDFIKRKYNVIPIIDVPVAYFFKYKGLLRTIGGCLTDLYRFKFKQFYNRILVIFNVKRDPYDTFKWIINKQKQFSSHFIFFFLIGGYSTYDKNISINKKRFISLIKSASDYSEVGIKSSYYALTDSNLSKQEIQKLKTITNFSVSSNRNSFSKISIPDSYRHLIELEIKKDFTMGYINHVGFRAGTCTPFLFYDLDFEIQTPLLIYSFNFIDNAFLKYASLLDKNQKLQRLINSVKSVNGTFVPIFHNYSLSDLDQWKGFKKMFSNILDSVNEK